jgi:hypothetical protein
MKITKRQLRRIIKEEKAKLLREQPPAPGSRGLVPMGADAGIDYGHFAKRLNSAAKEIESLHNFVGEALVAADQHSLQRDLEALMDSAFNLAVTFDTLSNS